jgi:hypothetical protein
VSAYALLAELASAGIQIAREGDNLKVRARAGTDLTTFTERVRDSKQELLAALVADGVSSSQSPTLEVLWVHVPRGEVEASKPPAGWDGTLPSACAWPQLCHTLGPCPRHLAKGACRVCAESEQLIEESESSKGSVMT